MMHVDKCFHISEIIDSLAFSPVNEKQAGRPGSLSLSLESNLVPSTAPAVPFTPREACAVDKRAGGVNRRPTCLWDRWHEILKTSVCKWTNVSKMMHEPRRRAAAADNDVTALASR